MDTFGKKCGPQLNRGHHLGVRNREGPGPGWGLNCAPDYWHQIRYLRGEKSWCPVLVNWCLSMSVIRKRGVNVMKLKVVDELRVAPRVSVANRRTFNSRSISGSHSQSPRYCLHKSTTLLPTLLLTFFLLISLESGPVSGAPAGDNEISSVICTDPGSSGNTVNRRTTRIDPDVACASGTELRDTCERCAKVTKSVLAYPLCCENTAGAREYCYRYLNYTPSFSRRRRRATSPLVRALTPRVRA